MRDPNTKLLRGRVVAVTGGSTAEGEAICKLMAEHGARVVVHGRPGEPVEDVVHDIEEAGGEAIGCSADMGTREGAEALVRTLIEAHAEAKASQEAREEDGTEDGPELSR
jgi:glucose 1-dehydrogenase